MSDRKINILPQFQVNESCRNCITNIANVLVQNKPATVREIDNIFTNNQTLVNECKVCLLDTKTSLSEAIRDFNSNRD